MLKQHIRRAPGFPACTTAALLALAAALPAWADGDRGPVVPPLKAYAQECGACHTAYPAGMLPAASWRRVMGGLAHHYGTDASLEAAAGVPIADWLQAHAGTYKRVSEEPPQDRITRSAWFERKHRKVGPAVWTLPAVKSAANCSACHTSADMGIYSERDLRIPTGLDPRLARSWRD